MTQLTLETRLIASADHVSADLDGEIAILHLRTGVYYGLNEVGGRIWALVKVPRTIAQIRDLVLAEFEVDPARCERDLFDLFATLAAQGLVTAAPPSSADSLRNSDSAPSISSG